MHTVCTRHANVLYISGTRYTHNLHKFHTRIAHNDPICVRISIFIEFHKGWNYNIYYEYLFNMTHDLHWNSITMVNLVPICLVDTINNIDIDVVDM